MRQFNHIHQIGLLAILLIVGISRRICSSSATAAAAFAYLYPSSTSTSATTNNKRSLQSSSSSSFIQPRNSYSNSNICAPSSTTSHNKKVLVGNLAMQTKEEDSFESASASKNNNKKKNENNYDNTKKTIRLLALHGSEGNADSFTERVLDNWKRFLLEDNNNINLEVTSLNAPFEKGNGYAWWTMAPGKRSFTAEEYIGYDQSSKIFLDALNDRDFDVVLGHSQGAILTASLLALDLIKSHPKIGYILNGVAWPNPYTKELESLRYNNYYKKEDDNNDDDEASLPPPPPRVLMIVGERDTMNPPEQAGRVEDALDAAGFQVTRIDHSGGHSVPTVTTSSTITGASRDINNDDDSLVTMQAIAKWLAVDL